MKWLVVIVALLVLFLFLQHNGEEKEENPREAGSPLASLEVSDSEEVTIPSEDATTTNSSKSHTSDLADYEAQVLSLSSVIPRLEDVRREVEKNPHNTPRSLIEFAKRLSPLMVSALEDPKRAEPMFRELERCALSRSQDIPESTQSLCMQNMKKLAESFPDQFEADFDKAMEEASEATINFIQFMEN